MSPSEYIEPRENVPSTNLLPPPDLTDKVLEDITDLKDIGSISRRDLLTGGTLVVAAGFVAYQIDRVVDRITIPNIDIDLSALESKPPVVEAQIAPEQYRYEVQPGYFEMVANSKVGVAVKVKGHKEGALWGLFGLTDADYDKVIFGDFLLATDEAKINNSLKVKKLNGEAIGVSATLDSMTVFQPRIDFSDYRNLIDINTKDTPEEIKKKTEEYVADGSHYDTNYGFECSGVCGDSSVELVNAANIIAQYAITIDAHQPDIIADSTERYRDNMMDQLATQYGVSPDMVKVDVVYGEGTDPNNPPTPEEVKDVYKQRMRDAYDESLRENGAPLFKIAPELRVDDDGNSEVYAKMQGGAELTVKLSGITYSPEIRDLILQNITDGGQLQGSPGQQASPENNAQVYSQLPAPNAQVYDQPPVPTTTGQMYDQPPAPNAQVYNQPPSPITSGD